MTINKPPTTNAKGTKTPLGAASFPPKFVAQIFDYLKCGDSITSVFPTVIFLLSAIKLICQLTYTLFRRSIFRRVPWWEGCIQDFINMVLSIHSLKTWRVYVQMLGWLVYVAANKYKYVKGYAAYFDVTIGTLLEQPYFLHQSLCWLSSLAILWITVVLFSQRDDTHHLIIWIATSPWTHTEIGSTAYYLHRPIALPARRSESTLRLRKTQSAITIKRPVSGLVARARSKSL